MGLGEGAGEGAGEGENKPDLEQRDPQKINDHLKVRFEDVLAEPEGAHSNDCVWKCAFCCFQCGKNCCYRFLAAICGSWLALCWGCRFACITFHHVWYYTPFLKMFSINCSFFQRIWGTCLQCCLAPICETIGLCLSRIQVLNLRDSS